MTKLQREVAARFAELRGDRSFDEFAQATGLPKMSLFHYERGASLPGTKAIVALAKSKEKVNPNWLMLGRGKPRHTH